MYTLYLQVTHVVEQLLPLSLVFGAFQIPFLLLLGPRTLSLQLLLLEPFLPELLLLLNYVVQVFMN